MKAFFQVRFAISTMLAAAALLVAAPAALAVGTVAVGTYGAGSVVFTAGAGVADALTVTAGSNSITFANTADTISESAAECSGSGTNTVSCNTPLSLVQITLGDQNDQFTANGTFGVNVSGGAGNDNLTGSDGNATSESLSGDEDIDVVNTRNAASVAASQGFLDGGYGGDGNDTVTSGSGDDAVSGGGGTDQVSAGPGDDQVIDGGGNNDVSNAGEGDDLLVGTGGDGTGDLLEGGPGTDGLLYLDSTGAPVPDAFDIDLQAGTAAKTNNGVESDTVSGVEDAATTVNGLILTYGNDAVRGTDGPNLIETAGGDDTINPRGGVDTVLAGRGTDSIDSRDGAADRVSCGLGTDTVQADQLDSLSDCENVTTTTIETTPPPPPPPPAEPAAEPDLVPPEVTLGRMPQRIARATLLRRGLAFEAGCNEPCSLEAELIGTARSARLARAGDLVLGTTSLGIGPGTRKGTVRIARRLRRTIRRRARLTFRITAADAAGNRRVLTRQIRVR